MRILNLINSAAPAGGGPIESIKQAWRVLSPRGHTFDLACLDRPTADWLNELPLTAQALGPAFTPFRYAPRGIPWLLQHAERYDCIIVHGTWLFPSFSAWITWRKTQVPYFIYVHGLLDPALKRLFPLKHFKKTLQWRLVEHRVVRDAAGMIFTGTVERDAARVCFSPYQAKELIVPYCVGEPPERDVKAVDRLFQAFPELARKRLVLFMSRLHPKKGCDLLIRAFAETCSQDPSLHLVIAGPDSIGWRAALEHLVESLGVKSRVTWTGMLLGELKWAALQAADVLVLPTHQENFGIILVEALACGTPVLTTRRTNLWSHIVEERAGLVGEDDLESVTEVLSTWCALSGEARLAFRCAARACFLNTFSPERAADQLLSELRRAVGARGLDLGSRERRDQQSAVSG